MRHTGCLLDHASARGNAAIEDLCGASPDVPAEIDRSHLLGDLVNAVRDQGGTPTCVGWGLARGLQLVMRAAGDLEAELPSARHIFRLGNGTFEGTTIGAAVEAMIDGGFCRESACPWDESLVYDALFWDEVQSGFDQRAVLAHRLLDLDRVSAVKRALSSGAGVVFGCDVDQSFEDYAGGIWTGLQGAREGGHCMAALDYTPEALRLVNSWGPAWGESGLGRISWDFVCSERMRSIWIVDVAPRYSA